MAVIGVGVDAVDVDRFRRVLGRRRAIVDRVFTAAEQEYAARATDPAARFAVRFAAKEAALKVLGTGIGGAAFSDFEVTRDEHGAPRLELRGRAAAVSEKMGIVRWHVSLTHTAQTAVATVIADGA